MEEFKTWEQLSRKEQLEAIFWDAYKDAHGFRPRHLNVSAMSEAELEAELSYLSKLIEEQEAARIEAEHLAACKFEQRVLDLIAMGAGDRETAIRWVHDAEGSNGDDEYLCFLLGLKYGYFREPRFDDPTEWQDIGCEFDPKVV